MEKVSIQVGALALATALLAGSTPAWAATHGSLGPAVATFPSTSASAADKIIDGGKLASGTVLKAGQMVRSQNGRNVLVQQPDGNLVLYRDKKATWSSETAPARGAATVMQKDGNLVMYKDGKALWGTETGGNPGAWLAVQDDGNLVIYGANGAPIWTRFAYVGKLASGKTLKAGQAVRSRNGRNVLVQQPDGNLVLYRDKKATWSSKTTPASGAMTVMQPDGNLVMYKDGKALWDTKTAPNPGAWLGVQDDGTVVVISKDQKPLWSISAHQQGVSS